MQIMEQANTLPEYQTVPAVVFTREKNPGEDIWQKKLDTEACLLREYLLKVFLNGKEVMETICTPINVPELVLGWLFSEGFLCLSEKIETINLNWQEYTAEVTVTSSARAGDDTPGRACFSTRTAPLCPVQKLEWREEWIWALDDQFQQDTHLHRQTHATHSSFLSTSGKILFTAEDIRRHNAVDKAIGYALLHHVPLGECVLYVTGRMPADLVCKVIRAGIPVLASKETPTMEGLNLARRCGLTLIGNIRRGSMCLYG